MTREADLERARAYLLGTAEEHESDALEEAYFESAGALDTVEAAEETLIEDYLSGALHSEDRTRFERHYLAAPQRRNRVEAIRKLMAHANRAGASVARRTPPLRVLAVAAALVIVAGASAAVWIAERGRGADGTGAAPTRILPTTSARSAPTKAPVTFGSQCRRPPYAAPRTRPRSSCRRARTSSISNSKARRPHRRLRAAAW